MIEYKDIVNSILSNRVDAVQEANISNAKLDIVFESFYESIFTSLISKIKHDPGDYSDVTSLFKLKKEISKATQKKHGTIISFCDSSQKDNFDKEINEYTFLYFLKFAVRMLDIDEAYEKKVNMCKYYFKDKINVDIFKKLYNNHGVSYIEIKSMNSTDLSVKTFNGLIQERNVDNDCIWFLSPEGKNLYAFYMMKNIRVEDEPNENEAKINEVLDYLIQYMYTRNITDSQKLKEPQLNSASANYKLKKFKYLFDRNYYSGNINQAYLKNNEKEFNSWKGDSNFPCNIF